MPGRTKTKRKTSKKGGKRRKSYGGSQLKKDLRSLEQLLGGYSSSGGKAEYDRYFTVHTVNGRPAKDVLKGESGRYGMSKSGGPLGAAKKAYTSMLHKLGLKNRGQSTELTFEMREVTQGEKRGPGNPIYGPYEGFREAIPKKLRQQDPFLKKHGIKHRAVVHLKGKKNMLKKTNSNGKPTTGGKRKSKRSSKKRGGSSCGSKKRSTVKGGDFWQFFN